MPSCLCVGLFLILKLHTASERYREERKNEEERISLRVLGG